VKKNRFPYTGEGGPPSSGKEEDYLRHSVRDGEERGETNSKELGKEKNYVFRKEKACLETPRPSRRFSMKRGERA